MRQESHLTKKDIIEIRNLLKKKILTQEQIGRKYKVLRKVISDIKLNKTWKGVV